VSGAGERGGHTHTRVALRQAHAGRQSAWSDIQHTAPPTHPPTLMSTNPATLVARIWSGVGACETAMSDWTSSADAGRLVSRIGSAIDCMPMGSVDEGARGPPPVGQGR
jgi:hypothetical protein